MTIDEPAPKRSPPDPTGSGDREKAPFWRPATVIGTGIVVTGLGWPGLIGRLPFGLLLKNTLHLPPETVAAFWAAATVPWYVKPVAGLICDSLPIRGTRRQGYLLGGASAAAIAWAGFAFIPRRYGMLLLLMIALNVALVFISATVGGMLVEQGNRHGATGRLSALRTSLEGAMNLVAGPLGGLLASVAFVWTGVAGAFIVALLLPVAWLLHREPRDAVRNVGVWTEAARQLRGIARSRSMWTTSILIFLVYFSPGLQTPLLYYQQDVLKFSVTFMSLLQFCAGIGVIAGSAVYVWLCRRLPLRMTLIAGIVMNAAASLMYLGYRSTGTALVIDTAAGFVTTVGTLPLFDLAARSTPSGSESFGYALMLSVYSIAVFGVSDVLGSLLYGRFHLGLDKLIGINALSSAAVLLFIPFLPSALLATREGKAQPAG